MKHVFGLSGVECRLADELIQEYFDVLSRPKFARFHNFVGKVESVLTEIGLTAELYKQSIKLNIISDQDEHMILELAQESNADFIITGNINDFTLSEYKISFSSYSKRISLLINQ